MVWNIMNDVQVMLWDLVCVCMSWKLIRLVHCLTPNDRQHNMDGLILGIIFIQLERGETWPPSLFMWVVQNFFKHFALSSSGLSCTFFVPHFGERFWKKEFEYTYSDKYNIELVLLRMLHYVGTSNFCYTWCCLCTFIFTPVSIQSAFELQVV